MAAQVRFCGRCGAPVAAGATFCGRCGTPQVGQAVAATPGYSYPVAPRARYPTAHQWRSSQIAVAGGLLAILAIVTVALSMFAVSHAIGGTHSPCTVDCGPKFVTPLAGGRTYP